jgi:hypothetical protein
MILGKLVFSSNDTAGMFLQPKIGYDFSGIVADLLSAKTVNYTASDYLFFGILAALLC